MNRRTRLYFDVCCLSRPFDDQAQERVRLESEAVKEILLRIGRKEWIWVGSDIVMFEIGRIADADLCLDVGLLTRDISEMIQHNDRDNSRAEQLVLCGFKGVDAMHVACAERGAANVLLTTDDGMLKTARRHAGSLKLKVMNPLQWFVEAVRR